MNLYYVYLDYTDNEIPFYAGYGDLSRFAQPTRNDKHTVIAGTFGHNRRLILRTDDPEIAKAKEMALIADHQLNAHHHPDNPFACNFTDGGDGSRGRTASESTKELLKVARRRRPPPSEATKNKISESRSRTQRGKKRNPDMVARINEKNRAIPVAEHPSIRRRIAEGESRKDLALEYDVSYSLIKKIAHGVATDPG